MKKIAYLSAAFCLAVFSYCRAGVVSFLEYVQATGTKSAGQAVLLDIVPRSDYSVEMEIQFDSGSISRNQSVFCSRGKTSSASPFTLFYLSQNYESGLRWDYNTDANHLVSGASVSNPKKILLKVDGNGLWVDDSQKLSIQPQAFSPVNKMMLFASYAVDVDKEPVPNADYGAFKLYSFRVRNGNGQLVVDLIPCLDDSGVAGLYDAVSQKVYTSITGSALASGPEVMKYNGVLKVSSTHGPVKSILPAPSDSYYTLDGAAAIDCSAMSLDDADTRATLLGYKVYDLDEHGMRIGDGTFFSSGEYVFSGGRKEVEWKFSNVEYKVDVTALPGGSAAQLKSGGWYAYGETATIQAFNDSGRFAGWQSDALDVGIRAGSTASFEVLRPISAAAKFSTPWVYDSSTKVLSNDVWCIGVKATVMDKVTGLQLSTCTAGSGICNLTDVEADTGYKVIGTYGSTFSANADVKAGITAFVAPELFKLSGNYENASTFENCTSLKYVRLSGDVTTIGICAFKNCSALKEFSPSKMEKLIYMGKQAFKGCSSLEGDFEFSVWNYTSSVPELFSGCRKITSISMPLTTRIHQGMFYDCQSLTNLYLPEVNTLLTGYEEAYMTFYNIAVKHLSLPKLTTVPNYAFRGFSKLETLYVPSLTTVKGQDQFVDCSSLTHLLPERNENLVTFSATSGRNTSLFYRCNMLKGDFDFPNLTELGASAFYKTSITSLKAPKLEVCGGGAFAMCNSLTNVVFGESLKSLKHMNLNYTDYGAFHGCTKLVSIKPFLASGIVELSNRSFYNCSSLATPFVLNDATVSALAQELFYNCSSIPSFTFNTPISSVGKSSLAKIGAGVTVAFGRKSLQAPSSWNATSPISGVSAPFPRIRVCSDFPSWEALSGYVPIGSVAEKYKTAEYGYDGSASMKGLFNSSAWVLDATPPAGTKIMIM